MRPAARRLAGCLALGLSLAAAGDLRAADAGGAEVQSVFPSDRETVPDPRQATGRRIALALPDCGADPAGCHEIRLLNELDGWSVNPRLAIRFSAPIDLATVTRTGAFVLPLVPEPLPSPIGLDQLVWDAASHTLYARPERPLLQARRYALVLTTRVLDDAGRPLAPTLSAPLVSEAAYGVSAQGVVFQRLKPLGIGRREVAAVTVFTTQTVTAALEQMRGVIETAPAPALRFALGPDGARSVYARAELEGLELRRQVAADPAAPLEEAVQLPLALVPPAEVRALAFGRFAAQSFLGDDRVIPATATRAEAPAVRAHEDVDVTVYLPAGTVPPDGWPVAIFGHGYGNDRHLVPMTVAGTMARFGYATVALNVVGHGGGPDGTLTVLRPGREPVTLPAGGRGVDVDGDGRIRSTEGVGPAAHSPLSVLSVRDGLRQTTADLMQLVRAIRRGVDVDGDGRPDLDRERIAYFGQSFGGIYGTLLMAVDPLVPVGVLNVAGGPIVEIARQSPSFRGLVVEQLRRRRPPLMNGEQDFTESIPLPGEAPVREPAAGALEIQAYLDRAEWLGQSANPVAFAPYLRRAPLLGVGAKAVLYQWAVGDRTVPNPTTAALLRAGLLQAVSSLYRHDQVPVLSERLRNPHGFLAWTGLPDAYPIGRAAQEQIARFFLSGGRQIDPVLPHFEIGVPPPARP